MDDKAIAEQAREYSDLLKNPLPGGVGLKKMAELIRFLEKHHVTLENPDYADENRHRYREPDHLYRR